MSEGELKAIAALFIFGVPLFWSAIRRLRRARLIQDTPTSKIASAPQGFVEVQGFAWLRDERFMVTPKKQQAVYYKLELQRKESRGSGKSRRRVWVTVHSMTHQEPFYVVDPTGVVLVDPEKAEMEISEKRTRRWNKLSPAEKDFLVAHLIPSGISGFPPSTMALGLFSTSFRVVEQEILNGGPVYLKGDFRTLGSGLPKIKERGLSRFVDRVIHKEARALKNVDKLLDQNGDGEVSDKEARTGYAMAAASARHAADQTEEAEFELYGQFASTPDHTLFVADAHETHLLTKMQRGNYLRFIGGAAMIALACVLSLRPFLPTASASKTLASSSPAPLMQIQHSACVDGQRAACWTLFQRRDVYGLSPAHVEYYRARGCQLGDKRACKSTALPK